MCSVFAYFFFDVFYSFVPALMIDGYHCTDYLSEERSFAFSQKTDLGLQLYMKVVCKGEKFIEYQKELLEDSVASMRDKFSREDMLEDDIKKIFEQELQDLNSSLEAFAAKVDTEDYFPLRWVVWVIYQGSLMASLIGDVSLFILRHNKIHYSMHNDMQAQGSIDVFADFIEWELELQDKISLVGTNYQNVVNKKELKQLDTVLEQASADLVTFMEKLFLSRISEEELSFIILFDYELASDDTIALRKKNTRKKQQLGYKNLQHTFLRYKYSVTVVILGIIVLFLGFQILKDAFQGTANLPQIETEDGVQIVTIESIQQDIDYFQRLDVSSNEKGRLYKDIMEKLHFLDSLARWPEDVANLKKIVQNKYYEGFNVVYMNSLDTSVDTPLLYPFSSKEKETLGTPVSVYFNKNLFVAGEQGAVMGGINADIKGTSLSYGMESTVQGCSLDLTRQGLFCYTANDEIIRITKGAVEPVSLSEGWYFDGPIKGIDVFNKNSLYVLHNDQYLNGSGRYITKYTNVLGEYTSFQPGVQYFSPVQLETWASQPNFSDFAIDGTFLTWSPVDKAVYHLWRSKGATMLSSRVVRMVGGDTIEESYSDDVKVISLDSSYYVYLFDRKNQTFTVYRSTPSKVSENNNIIQDPNFAPTYALNYVFRFKFDLAAPILDVAIPGEAGNKPYLYVLTDQWVHQISLHEFIKQYQE